MTAVTPRSEEAERHAVAHASYACSLASNYEPDVCLDYELVQTLLSLIERLRLAAKPADERVREIVEQILERRAQGFEARDNTIFNGRIIADELRANIREIRVALSTRKPKP